MATITYDSELMHNAVLGPSNQTAEITSYTITLFVIDSDGFPLSSGSVVLGASPAIEVIVNGDRTKLTSPGNWHTLDGNGAVTLIVQADSITSSNFWVTGAKNAKNTPVALNPVTGVSLNPSHKVVSKFSSINEHTDISQLRGQSGKLLWPQGKELSSKDFHQAGQVLQNSGQMLKDVQQNQPAANIIPNFIKTQQSAVEKEAQLIAAEKRTQGNSATHVRGSSTTHIEAASAIHIQRKFNIRHGLESIGNAFHHAGDDIGHGIDHGVHSITSGLGDLGHDITGGAEFIGKGFESGVKDIKDFTVNKTGDAWRFVYKVNEDTKTFVIRTIQDLSAVLDFVWGTLQLGIEELIDFAGFLFEWEDIKNTSNYIKGILNATLNYGVSEVGVLEVNVNSFITDAKSKIKNRLEKHTSAPAASTGQTSISDTKSKSQAVGPVIGRSPALNFLNERYQNGGIQTSFLSHSPSASSADRSSQFHQSIMPFKGTMEGDLKQIGRDLSNLFKSTKSLKTAEVWEALGNDTLDSLLDALNAMIQGILKGLADLIRDFQSVGNAGIHIPIISDLLRLKGFGELSAFDLVCTLLGFMVCVFYKLIAHRTLKLPSEDPNTLIPKLLRGEVSKLDKPTISLIETIGEFTATLGIRIYRTVTMVKALAEQGPTGGATKAQPSTLSGPISVKSLPFFAKAAMKVISSIMSLRCDKSAPGYEFSQAASCVSFINTVATVIYNFTASGLPEEVQAIEEFYFMTALINFALYDGAAAEMIVATATTANKEHDALAAEQCATENVCNTLASAGQYVGMMTAMAVDETEEAGPEVELAEVVALVGFSVYCGASDALLVNKAVNIVTSVETEVDDVRGVASNA